MTLRPALLLFSLALLFVPACSTPTASSHGGPAPSLSEYHTFAVAPLPSQGPSSDPAAASRLGEVARTAIVETLKGKGFSEAEPSSADFIVQVQTEFWQDQLIESSEKRYITIALHDRHSDVVIWSDKRGRSSSRTMEPEFLQQSIFEMLSALPSSNGAPAK